jgi:hypothetical protein
LKKKWLKNIAHTFLYARLGHWREYHYSFDDTTSVVLFNNLVSTNYSSLTEVVGTVFEEKNNFVFGSRMLIFSGHRPVMDDTVNTIPRGAVEEHIMAFQKPPFCIQGS